MVGIKQTKFNLKNFSTSVQIPVESRPYGILIACNEQTGYIDTNYTLLRYCAIWSEYNGGIYAGMRNAAITKSGYEDHWATSQPVYDDVNKTITVTSSACSFAPDRDYYVWSFTIPF